MWLFYDVLATSALSLRHQYDKGKVAQLEDQTPDPEVRKSLGGYGLQVFESTEAVRYNQ